LTSNQFVGAVPSAMCQDRGESHLLRQFQCDAIICPADTFHPQGAATSLGGCQRCPRVNNDEDAGKHKFLGRTTCHNVEYEVGDINGDGAVSAREILRLLFLFNDGPSWGDQYQTWVDMNVHECALAGIECVNGNVANIDLAGAVACSNSSTGATNQRATMGIPSILGRLSHLEVLSLPRKQIFSGTIPTEIGMLTSLKLLDLSSNRRLSGSIPTEIGRLTNLKVLNLSNCRITGTIPTELGRLRSLEKLHMSVNPIHGTLPSEIGNLRNIREVMISRLFLVGRIPTTIGKLSLVENIEIYGNGLVGTIPQEIAQCTNLKRLDAFNNRLGGTIPADLAEIQSLQIIHLKKNRFSGTLPSVLGGLQFLSWFDASTNKLSGTIPASYGSARVLKDLRLGENRIHEPIPHEVCANDRINGGRTRTHGCDGILCPIGTYSDSGFADQTEGCKMCDERETTMYLGSSSCIRMHAEEILAILFDVMGGQEWDEQSKAGWKDHHTSACEWEGIVCRSDGTIIRISFPVVNDGNLYLDSKK